ncbi:MAG: hypothetical protein LUF87_10750 [Alistipes sp.]|nr:hypothetical protein [Alistipes sp.]
MADSTKTRTKRASSTGRTAAGNRSDRLDAADRKKLRSSDYGLPDKREFPMPDATHVRAAEAYFRYASKEDKPQLAHRILMKAKKYGVNVESDTIRDWAKKK